MLMETPYDYKQHLRCKFCLQTVECSVSNNDLLVARQRCTDSRLNISDEYKNNREIYGNYFSLANWENAMNDFARINVYMADSSMTVTEEIPDYELSQLISDIGGQLGCWIGMSVITLSETLALLFQLMRYCCSRVFRRCKEDQLKCQEAV